MESIQQDLLRISIRDNEDSRLAANRTIAASVRITHVCKELCSELNIEDAVYVLNIVTTHKIGCENDASAVILELKDFWAMEKHQYRWWIRSKFKALIHEYKNLKKCMSDLEQYIVVEVD